MSVYSKENPFFLKESLKSIWVDQTVMPSEIVLVKDGRLTKELDRIIEDAKNDMPLRIVTLEKNQGLGVALNKGLLKCSYELVARMDTDDISKSNRFEMQTNIFKNYDNVDVVGSWTDEFINETENIKSVRKVPENHDEIKKYSKKRSPVNHPTVMFKKEAVLKAGNYIDFPLFEDYHLWGRMIMLGAKFYNIQKSLLFFRTTNDTYRRRGNLKHGVQEIKLQLFFFKIGLINFYQLIVNIVIRFSIRILPNFIRMYFYKSVLR